jgi:hypothetical protein
VNVSVINYVGEFYECRPRIKITLIYERLLPEKFHHFIRGVIAEIQTLLQAKRWSKSPYVIF